MDGIKKYIYGSGVKIQVAEVSGIIEKLIDAQEISVCYDRDTLTAAGLFCCLISSELKEASSYNTVSYKNNAEMLNYTVVGYGDGRFCGYVSEYEPVNDLNLLEVDRHSDVGGDYTSVVAGGDIDSIINTYIEESMQREAVFRRVGRDGLFVENLPGASGFGEVAEIAASSFPRLDDRFRLIEEKNLEYGCHCSKRSVKRSLSALSAEEQGSFTGPVEVRCRFCGKKYVIEDL